MVTSYRNPTQTGLNTRRESSDSENFPQRLAIKQSPKANLPDTASFRALLMSPRLRSPSEDFMAASHGSKMVVAAPGLAFLAPACRSMEHGLATIPENRRQAQTRGSPILTLGDFLSPRGELVSFSDSE